MKIRQLACALDVAGIADFMLQKHIGSLQPNWHHHDQAPQ